jgi:hypothetical protein
MIKKIKPYLKVKKIDVLIYYMAPDFVTSFPSLDYQIDKQIIDANKTKYSITVDSICIHKSFLFKKLNILKLIHRKGPTIGDCVTIPDYKGKSIYPFVINHIAGEVLKEENEVFIIVNSDNASSIRGIEKAGFKLHTKIKAKRFLLFYYNVKRITKI